MPLSAAAKPVSPLVPVGNGYTTVMWGSSPEQQMSVTLGYDPKLQARTVSADVAVTGSGGLRRLQGTAPADDRRVAPRVERLEQALAGVDLLDLRAASGNEPAPAHWTGFAMGRTPGAVPRIISIASDDLPARLNLQLNEVRRSAYLLAQAVDQARAIAST